MLTCQYNGGANNNGFIDQSSFNNVITRNGNATQGTFTPYSQNGWSNYFNGSSYLEYANQTAYSPGTGDFTLECWVYHTVAAGSNTWYVSHISGGVSFYRDTAGKLAFAKDAVAVIATSTNTLPVNTWTHVAVARSGTSFKMFINGSQEASVTDATNITSTGLLDIGCTAGVSGAMTGYISNVRLVKGSALYTSAFTLSTTPLTPVTNTQLLICQSNRFVDNSPNNFAVNAVGGTTSVQAFDPFGSVPEAVPISYSNFFDGTGDYLSIPTNSALELGSGDYTIEGWWYFTDTSNQALVSKYNASGGYVVQYQSNNLRMVLNTGGAGQDVVYSFSWTPVASVWYHIAITRSGTNGRAFINGVQIGTTTTFTTSNAGTSSPLQIGSTQTVTELTRGYVSNLRIVKGTAVYTSNFTPSTTPLTAIANTSLLTCQSTTMIDNSTNNFTITAAGNTVPRIFNPFGYTAQSATSYTPSLHGGSAYFDGAGDYLTAPYNPYLFGSNDFTVECWIYPVAALTSTPIVGVWRESASSSSNSSWSLRGGLSNTIYFYHYTSGGTFTSLNSATGAYSLNTWNHLAVVRYGSTLSIYVNGVLYNSAAISVSLASPTTTNLGIAADATTGGVGLNTYISDLRIINGTALYTSSFVPPTTSVTAIPKTSLLLNFTSGGIIDQHGSNVLETVGNAQLSTAVKKYGSASMYFDGTGDYLTIPTNPGFVFGTGDFTIEAWFYIVSGAAGAIFDTRSGATGITPLLFFSSSTLRYYVNGADLITSPTTLSAATWYHVALVRSSGSSKMYLNGAQTGSTVADVNNFCLLYTSPSPRDS